MCTPRYKDTDWFRSVAGKLSGLAVGEGLRIAKRRRGLASVVRACVAGRRVTLHDLRNSTPDPD